MIVQGRTLLPLLLLPVVLLLLLLLSYPGAATRAHAQGGVAAPPLCVASTSEYFNSASLQIPTGPAMVTSGIDVSSADPYLLSVELVTELTHTFPADLDITVRSPAGTVVTLTTDNGEDVEAAFAAVTWTDRASPAGQVPYASAVGIVTDHPFPQGAPTELVPEEALGAFRGEDPSGRWTLTIWDDAGGQGGRLLRWGLRLTTLTSVPTVRPAFTVSAAPALPIPPVVGVIEHSIQVSGADPYLIDVDLRTAIVHTFPGDLDITIRSPGGLVSTLTSDNGGSIDDVFRDTFWDDDANSGGTLPYLYNDGVATEHLYKPGQVATPLVPEEALALFQGIDPNGTWTLRISDDTDEDGGMLNGWSLIGWSASCAPPPTGTRLLLPTVLK